MLSLKTARTTHYELHGQTNNRWTMLEVFDNKDKAALQAEQIFRSGLYRSIRLLRERYDDDLGTFDSHEILFLGQRSKPSKYDHEDQTVFCNSVTDLYSRSSRRTMARLFAPILDAMEITPAEILHNPDLYARLQGSGTHLMNAVQRLAIAQVKQTREPVAERIRGIYNLIDEAIIHVRQTKQAGLPRLDKGRFSAFLDQFSPGKERPYQLAIVIAEDLGALDGTLAKLERLISMMRFDHPDWARGVLDLFLSEQLLHRRLVRTVLPADSLVLLLEKILTLSEGQLDHGESPLITTLNAFLKAGLLPATRAILVGHIRHELATKTRIADNDLSKEFTALARLNTIMGDYLDTETPDQPLADHLASRMARMLNPQTLGDYLIKGRNPADQLQRLIVLEKHCIGAANRRTLVNYMLPLLMDGANESFWMDPRGAGYSGHMRLLTRLQSRLLHSELQDLHKDRLCGRLDELCTALLTKSKILDRLDRSDAPVFDKGCRILKMLVDNHFTKGQCEATARTHIQRYLSDPAFLAYLEKMPKGQKRTSATDRLKNLLDKGGPDIVGTS